MSLVYLLSRLYAPTTIEVSVLLMSSIYSAACTDVLAVVVIVLIRDCVVCFL